MPELPEVETVRRSLTELILGKTIQNVLIRWPKIIKNPIEHEQFVDSLKGETFREVKRKGKFLIFLLDQYSLVSHLRMEGNYSVHEADEEPDKHVHVIFQFTDGTALYYRDVRKFGTMHLFNKGTEESIPPLSQLGPEPMSDECSYSYLLSKFQKTERFIKAVLLDQTVVTGLGNIYVDEVLYRAQIHPERRASSLTKAEVKRIRVEAKATLEESIKAGGSSVNSYMNAHGISGTYQEQLQVYGRTGEPCNRCGGVISKIRVAGRGTHFCANCQKENS